MSRTAPGKSRKRRKKAFFLRYPRICLSPISQTSSCGTPNYLFFWGDSERPFGPLYHLGEFFGGASSAAEKRGLWEGVVQEPLRRAWFCVFLCSDVIFSCKSHRNFFQKVPLQCRHFLETPLAKNPKTQLLTSIPLQFCCGGTPFLL